MKKQFNQDMRKQSGRVPSTKASLFSATFSSSFVPSKFKKMESLNPLFNFHTERQPNEKQQVDPSSSECMGKEQSQGDNFTFKAETELDQFMHIDGIQIGGRLKTKPDDESSTKSVQYLRKVASKGQTRLQTAKNKTRKLNQTSQQKRQGSVNLKGSASQASLWTKSTRGGQITTSSLGHSLKDKRVQPGPIKRSNDEIKLLQMQNIYSKTSKLFKTNENEGAGADLATLPSDEDRSGAKTAMQIMYGAPTSRNIAQPMLENVENDYKTKQYSKKQYKFGGSIGFLSLSQKKQDGKASQHEKKIISCSLADLNGQDQLSRQQTAEKRPYQHLRTGITFGETTLFSPKPVQINASLSSSKQDEQQKENQFLKVTQFPIKSSLATTKMRSSYGKNKKGSNNLSKSQKPREWPSQNIANQYAMPGFKYKKEATMLRGSQLLYNSKISSESFESESLSALEKEKNLLKLAPAEIDKLYQLPHGEMAASDRVKLHRSRTLQDIARARQNAEIEIKFRERYEKDKDLPNEFLVMPDPTLVFAEDKAKETIQAIRENNFEEVVNPPQNITAQGSSRNFLGLTLQESKRSMLSVPGGSMRNILHPNFGGSSHNLIAQSSRITHKSSANNLSAHNLNQSQMNNGQNLTKQKKQDTRVAPGVLSNNLKKSHLMNFLNKEHQLKLKEKDKIEQRKQHYCQSTNQSRAIGGTDTATDLNKDSASSFLGENVMPFGQPVQRKRFMTVDSPATSKSLTSSISSLRNRDTMNLPLNIIVGSAINQKEKRTQQLKLNGGRSASFKFRRQNCMKMQTNKKKQSIFLNYELERIQNYPGVNLHSDPVHTTEWLYKLVLITAVNQAQKIFETKEKDNQAAIDLLKQMIPLAKFALELVDTLMLYKLIATLEYQGKKYNKVLEICHLMIHMCANRESLAQLRLDALKMAGHCLMHKHQYEDALHSWKLSFEHCIRTGNEEAELMVYEQMSYCYFYLGQMKQAEYFNTRYRMGVLEGPNSQIKAIYTSLRRNDQKTQRWDKAIQYVNDINWRGESLFNLFYRNFLEDCQNKEKITKDLIQGRFHASFDLKRCKLSRRLATALLKKVGNALRELNRRKQQGKSVNRVQLDQLEPTWRNSYHLRRRGEDCHDLVNLRIQIYKVCEQTDITKQLPTELQCELETVSDYIQQHKNLKLNFRENLIQSDDNEKNRILRFPKLGIITVKDYDLLEMPAPTMVNINAARFDFKSSIRNPNFLMGKQYESQGIKQVCPHLYAKNFKKESVPRQFAVFDNALPSVSDPEYKKSLILRAQMRKTQQRDLIFMSHMTKDKQSLGKFISETERKKFNLQHFNELLVKLQADLDSCSSLNEQSSTSAQPALQASSKREALVQEMPHVNLDSPEKQQLEQAKQILRHCMPIRAFVYGQDLTRELINFEKHIHQAEKKSDRYEKQKSEEFVSFSDAALTEKLKTIGNYQPQTLEENQSPHKQKDIDPSNPSCMQKHDSLRTTFKQMSEHARVNNSCRSLIDQTSLDLTRQAAAQQQNLTRGKTQVQLFQQRAPKATKTQRRHRKLQVTVQDSLVTDLELSFQQSSASTTEQKKMQIGAMSSRKQQRDLTQQISRSHKQLDRNFTAPLKFKLAEIIPEEDNEAIMAQINLSPSNEKQPQNGKKKLLKSSISQVQINNMFTMNSQHKPLRQNSHQRMLSTLESLQEENY